MFNCNCALILKIVSLNSEFKAFSYAKGIEYVNLKTVNTMNLVINDICLHLSFLSFYCIFGIYNERNQKLLKQQHEPIYINYIK